MPAALHVDEHLPGLARRHGERREAQRVEVPALAGFEPQRHGRIERLLARRACRGRAAARSALRRGRRLRARCRRVEQLAPKRAERPPRKAPAARSMPRQARFGCSLRMTRKRPSAGACATAVGCASRPTGCAPRVTRSMRSFAAIGSAVSSACARWSSASVPRVGILRGDQRAHPAARDRQCARAARPRRRQRAVSASPRRLRRAG